MRDGWVGIGVENLSAETREWAAVGLVEVAVTHIVRDLNGTWDAGCTNETPTRTGIQQTVHLHKKPARRERAVVVSVPVTQRVRASEDTYLCGS